MIEIIVPATVAIIIMMVFSFFIFKNIAKRINNGTKKHFIEKLQDYDDMIAEKTEELKILRQEIESVKREIEANKDMQAIEEKVEKKVDLVYNIPTPEYREEAFFRNYKDLQKLFDIDEEEVIKDFINKHKTNKTKEYTVFNKVKDYFNKEAVYQLLTLDVEDQIAVIKDVIPEKEKEVINFNGIMEGIKEFDILKFLNRIEEQIDKKDPTVYVYVGKRGLNFDYISGNVKTQFYNYMSEGVIIQYQEKIYDYSI